MVCLLRKGEGGHHPEAGREKIQDRPFQGPGRERPGYDVADHYEPGDTAAHQGHTHRRGGHQLHVRPAGGGQPPGSEGAYRQRGAPLPGPGGHLLTTDPSRQRTAYHRSEIGERRLFYEKTCRAVPVPASDPDPDRSGGCRREGRWRKGPGQRSACGLPRRCAGGGRWPHHGAPAGCFGGPGRGGGLRRRLSDHSGQAGRCLPVPRRRY